MTAPVASWERLLREAVSEPGLILAAYTAFHNYSVGNQLLALVQCKQRGIEPGPLSTYMGWQAKGRQVRKGERALTLCMPVTVKAKDEADEEARFTRFVYKPRWFVLAQTEGEAVEVTPVPGWSKERALTALGIAETPFTLTDGNVQGYARRREVSINPLAALPGKTLCHELAHVVLGHTAEADLNDTERTPRSLREVEAEAVALLLCEALGLQGAAYARGYVQKYLGDSEEIPERSAQKIFAATDAILKAGAPQGC